tara:strand:+ start:2391 stop:2642 length:252 start_codon:yes stop_codon:yes gene_type:complete
MPWLDDIRNWFVPKEKTPAAVREPVTMKFDNRPVVQPFTVLLDFYCEELASAYCAGMSYNARVGDETLQRLLPEWKAAGKVTY